MPSPVVLGHILRANALRTLFKVGGRQTYTKSSIDASLSSHSMTSGREKLGYAGSLEASLCETKGSTETGTTGTAEVGGDKQ